MNYKNIVLPTAIVGVIVLIIIGGFIFLNPNNPEGDKQKESDKNGTIIEKSENEKVIHTSSFGKLKRTSDPKFKVGEKYFYHRWEKIPDTADTIFVPEEYDTVVEVKKMERLNKSNYYVLESKNVSFYSYILENKNGVWKRIHSMQPEIYEGCTVGINEENGKLIKIDVHSSCPVLDGMYADWMLYLDKGVRWVEKYNLSGAGERGQSTVYAEIEWSVVDIEKINGRECFKVVAITKTKIRGMEGEKISNRIVTYWVDTKKRILVKMERKEDNVLTETIELKNYESAS